MKFHPSNSFPEEHFIIHDFDTGRGNIDHILVGPKGIITLELKSHRGKVTFDGTILRRDGLPFGEDLQPASGAGAAVM